MEICTEINEHHRRIHHAQRRSALLIMSASSQHGQLPTVLRLVATKISDDEHGQCTGIALFSRASSNRLGQPRRSLAKESTLWIRPWSLNMRSEHCHDHDHPRYTIHRRCPQLASSTDACVSRLNDGICPLALPTQLIVRK